MGRAGRDAVLAAIPMYPRPRPDFAPQIAAAGGPILYFPGSIANSLRKNPADAVCLGTDKQQSCHQFDNGSAMRLPRTSKVEAGMVKK